MQVTYKQAWEACQSIRKAGDTLQSFVNERHNDVRGREEILKLARECHAAGNRQACRNLNTAMRTATEGKHGVSVRFDQKDVKGNRRSLASISGQAPKRQGKKVPVKHDGKAMFSAQTIREWMLAAAQSGDLDAIEHLVSELESIMDDADELLAQYGEGESSEPEEVEEVAEAA
jgi:hypothetical protein